MASETSGGHLAVRSSVAMEIGEGNEEALARVSASHLVA